MTYRAFLLPVVGFLGVGSCQHLPDAPPPSKVKSEPILRASVTEQGSKASAAVQAASLANQSNPEGMPKTAVQGELSVAAANLPLPDPKDQQEATLRVTQALQGKLSEAQAAWAKASQDAASLQAKVAELQAKVDSEQKQAALELQRQLAQARSEAEQKAKAQQQRLIALIFYGSGAVLIAAAAAMLLLGPSVPIFGPRASLAAGAGGAALIATGIALNTLLSHEWVIWVGLGAAAIALCVSAALIYSNSHHGPPPEASIPA